MQSVLMGMSTTLEFPLETQTCFYLSWRIMLSSHHDDMDMGMDMGRNFKDAKVYTFGGGRQQIFLATRQVQCYHFTPSQAVTAPCSSLNI